MYTEMSRVDLNEVPVWEQTGTLTEAAETLQRNALTLARAKLPVRQQDLSLPELLRDRAFVDYFKYAMAQEVAQVIATYDQRTLAVYVFDESANPDAETEDYAPTLDLTVRLLVLVAARTAALEAFIQALDRVLTSTLQELPSALLARRTSILNIIPVTEDDVQEGRGYATLLSSFYARPVRIWQRE